MTEDDAVFWLKQIKERYIKYGDEEFDRCRKEALDMAIEALQEPRESYIANVDLPEEELERIFHKVLHESVQVFPPERKTGKWIDRTICSNCNWYATNRYGLAVDSYFPYCPNCGAKMEVDE